MEGDVKNRRLEVMPIRTTSNPRDMAHTSLDARLFSRACLTKLSRYIGATILATLALVSARNGAPGPAEEFAMSVCPGVWTPPGWKTLDSCEVEPSTTTRDLA